MDRLPRARLLVVDDQEDVRMLLVTALEIEGYDVVSARDARDGLRCLGDGRFALVITDYAMPGGTGIWMLHEASRRGLLDGTPALVVTADPDVCEDARGFPIMRKPLDLDRFLGQVHHLIKAGTPPESMTLAAIELVLYVSSASFASHRARRNLEAFLSECPSGAVRLTVKDLYHDPLAGEADAIVVTPTLVKVSPSPRLWIVGSLHDRQVLDDLLEGCAGLDAVN
jgi:two-component system response regulator GlrR